MKVTKHFFALAALLLALMLPGAAWADSVTYDFTGTLATPFKRQWHSHRPVYDRLLS